MIYQWKCQKCEVQVDIVRPIADSSVPPDVDIKCTCETPEWKRVYSVPMMTKASYLDGTRRFTAVKEAQALNREAISSKSNETKKEIAAEIRKLGVRVTDT